jgi:hypothetical protein
MHIDVSLSHIYIPRVGRNRTIQPGHDTSFESADPVMICESVVRYRLCWVYSMEALRVA